MGTAIRLQNESWYGLKSSVLACLLALSFFASDFSLAKSALQQTEEAGVDAVMSAVDDSQSDSSDQSDSDQSNSNQSNSNQSKSDQSISEQSYFDKHGFRSQRYRAPLPDNVPGGKVVLTDNVHETIDQVDPVLIDVLSVTLRTEAIDFGISWLPESPRENIPGSVWLPNVGRAGLEPFMLKFFSDHLIELTANNKDHPILFYCIADCWMSWNAVKRASEWGYSNLYWFPEGTDGWVASGGELAASEPESIIDYIADDVE